MGKHLFCFGLGYTANYVMKSIIVHSENTWKFTGTKRYIDKNPDNKARLIKFTDDLIIPSDVTHILLSIPPGEQGDLVAKLFTPQILNLDKLEWIGYLSSTSVYGNHHGNWVNETSITIPSTNKSKNRLIAENNWLTLYRINSLPVTIFRVAGIYGNHRNQIHKIMNDEYIPVINYSGHIFSRIHIEDLTNLLLHSMIKPFFGEIFNIADDYPCESMEVVAYAYQLLNKIPPSPILLENAELSDTAMEFYQDSKKIDNTKIKQYWNLKLRYPSYKEGLNNIAEKYHSN